MRSILDGHLGASGTYQMDLGFRVQGLAVSIKQPGSGFRVQGFRV